MVALVFWMPWYSKWKETQTKNGCWYHTWIQKIQIELVTFHDHGKIHIWSWTKSCTNKFSTYLCLLKVAHPASVWILLQWPIKFLFINICFYWKFELFVASVIIELTFQLLCFNINTIMDSKLSPSFPVSSHLVWC